MDSHSRSASPREQPRPQQRPPSPPSPRLPPAAFDNRAYQHDDADPNHNESFTSNGAHQNGHNKEPNGESKSHEAVNLELINLTPKNGSLKQKKDVEVDMNGSNPYDEYFVPVNEHRKYMRGEKLYVTADKRGEKGGCKRPLCWTLLALVVAAIIALIALAATGVIFSNSPTPVDPYNVSISSARALAGIGQTNEGHDHNHEQHDLSHENSNDQNQEQHDHSNGQDQEQHDHSIDQNQEQHNKNNDENPEQHGQSNDQNIDHEQHNLDNGQNHEQHDEINDQGQEQPNQIHDENQNEHNQEQSDQVQDHMHNETIDNQNHEQGETDQNPDLSVQDHQEHENGQDQDLDLGQHQPEHDQVNPGVVIPETQSDDHSVVPEATDMSMYVPRTLEGELKIDNDEFLDAYNNPESEEYRQFTDSFKDALMQVLFDRTTLENGDNDVKLEVIQLRPGSIIVTYRINWRPRYEDSPKENLFNATTLQENINNYLINNNRMISIYHIAEDNLTSKPVLDLCQINKNDCQDGCEFDETTLDFGCTCPQGFILDINHPKTCVPYPTYQEPKPQIENSSMSPVTTTTKVVNFQIGQNSSGFDSKDIEDETTTEAESDLKFSNTFDEHMKNMWDIEPTIEHKPQITEAPESSTKQIPDVKFSVAPEISASESQTPVTELPGLSAETQNNSKDGMYVKDDTNVTINENVNKKTETNTDILEEPKPVILEETNTDTMEEPKTDSMEEPNPVVIEESKSDTMGEPKTGTNENSKIDSMEEPKSELIDEPNTNQDSEEENAAIPHISQLGSTNITTNDTESKPIEYETPTSSNDSESELDISHYPDSAFNIDALLGSRQVVKPEEVYTEQPEPIPNEQNEPKDMPRSFVEPEDSSKSNDTLLSPDKSISMTTSTVLQPDLSLAVKSDENIGTNTTTITTASPTTYVLQQDFNTIKSQSQEPKTELTTQENEFRVNPSEPYLNTDNNKTEAATDDIDDWLSDTLPLDNKTLNYTANDNTHLFDNHESSVSNPSYTVLENSTELKSSMFNSNESDTSQTSSNHNELDMNALLGLLGDENNATKVINTETEDYYSNPAVSTDDLESGRSFSDSKDFKDYIINSKNETNDDYEKKEKEEDSDLPSITSESRGPMSQETNTSQQFFTSESPEGGINLSNPMPQDILKAMESLDEPQTNKTVTNMTISDDGKYVTFDDINMLLNRSSKSMENLTQTIDDKELHENTENKTFDLRDSSPKQNDSEWISETVTEVNYNEEPNKVDKTETPESVKTKIDQIMAHSKDDYEPDYLSKADDSMYMMERDYETEDPRVKRVNSDSKNISTARFSTEKNIETNSIFNVPTTTLNELSSTNAPSMLPNYLFVNETSTTLPSTSVTDYSLNAAANNLSDVNQISVETNTFLNTSQHLNPEFVQETKELNNISDSVTAKPIQTEELNPVSSDTTKSSIFSSQSEINNISNTTEASSNSYNQNGTQLNNLEVTIYEISHHQPNHSLPVSKSTNNPMTEYDDHEPEMNPFLPEAENNKNLVKKLQEGHDFELTNMNETQNENSDEHTFNNTENHVIISNETFNVTASTTTDNLNGKLNLTTTEDTLRAENEDKNILLPKVGEDKKVNENVELGHEVLPISTFLIDTDDLDARARLDKISGSTSTQKDASLTQVSNSGNDNLSVVPITGETEEKASAKYPKIQSSYELNDISDTLKNSEKRTFELTNFEPITNNES